MMKKVIQITAGKGPLECCWVVAKVLKCMIEEIEKKHFQYKIISREQGSENRTLKSVILQLEGEDIMTFLKDWLGTIQWIGSSTFRKHTKRKNWFVGCFLLHSSKLLEIDQNEIQFQAIRSSGPGGQHVNKVSSAVRAIHKPTGIYVMASDTRSQHRNKKLAIERLQERITFYNFEQLKYELSTQWENHLTLERGNPIRIFKGTDFKRQKKEPTYKSKRQKLKNDLKKQSWE